MKFTEHMVSQVEHIKAELAEDVHFMNGKLM